MNEVEIKFRALGHDATHYTGDGMIVSCKRLGVLYFKNQRGERHTIKCGQDSLLYKAARIGMAAL